MKHFLSFVLLFTFYVNALAQVKTVKTADVKLGKPYKVIDAELKDYFLLGDQVVAIKTRGRSMHVQLFDTKTMNLLKTNEFEDFEKGFQLEEIHQFGDRLLVFYSLWDKGNEIEQLFCREVDVKNAAFKGVGKLVLKSNRKLTGVFGSKKLFWYGTYGVGDKFDIHHSYDTTKILVQYRLRPEIKDDSRSKDIIGLFVFDKNLKKLWGEEIEMPYTEKKMNNKNYSVDADGNVFILTTVYDDNTTDIKKAKGAPANYHVEMLRVLANTKKILSTKLRLDDKFIESMDVFEGPNKKSICAGFYSDGTKRANANGIFTFKIESDGKLSDIRNYEIPIEIINQYSSERAQRKNIKKEIQDRADLEDLVFRKVEVLPDGSVMLIGEQYKVEVITRVSTNGSSSTSYIYHYDDILVTKINPNGELAWMRKLPKRQKGSSGLGGLSFKYFYDAKSDNNYFVFLDNLKNLDLSINNEPSYHVDGLGGAITAFAVSGNEGIVNKVLIGDMKDIKGTEIYQFKTFRIIPLGENKMIFEVYKKDKEDILITVNFNAGKTK